MVIGVLTVEYALHGNDSLKGKRRVANSLKQKAVSYTHLRAHETD